MHTNKILTFIVNKKGLIRYIMLNYIPKVIPYVCGRKCPFLQRKLPIFTLKVLLLPALS